MYRAENHWVPNVVTADPNYTTLHDHVVVVDMWMPNQRQLLLDLEKGYAAGLRSPYNATAYILHETDMLLLAANDHSLMRQLADAYGFVKRDLVIELGIVLENTGSVLKRNVYHLFLLPEHPVHRTPCFADIMSRYRLLLP